MRIRFVWLLILSLLLAGCTTTGGSPEKAVRERARLVMTALEAGSGEGVARYVHPTKGVRFSPYAHVRTESGGDLVFTAAQLTASASDQNQYTWGIQDGSGEPIKATITDYLKRFDRPYLAGGQVGYNQVIKTGNTQNNLAQAYPGAVFVEYHLLGTGEQADHNWSSVRLVFQQEKGTWYLVGVISDQWTI